MRAVFVLMWVVTMLMTNSALAQQSPAAPMDVARFATLKAASVRPGESAWAKVAYREYVNGLIDGLIDKEGDKFCLPSDIRAARAEILFAQLSNDVEEAIKSATPKDLVAVATRKFLAQKYPCKR